MTENTKISWATHTFNPWIGCSRVHTGCTNCYAESMSGRFGVTWGPNGTRRRTAESTWKQVEKWNRAEEPFLSWSNHGRPRVFLSLCDPFEDWQGPILNTIGVEIWRQWDTGADVARTGRPSPRHSPLTMDDVRRDFFALIDRCRNLDFLLLTKRPENVRRMWCSHVNTDGKPPSRLNRKNVWLIYSASDQKTLEAGLPQLLACRDLVPVIGLSLEPLVGPVDLDRCWPGGMPCPGAGPYVNGVDWVIVGGESGPRARPCNVEWIRSIVEQCAAANVPCFAKQLGSHVFTTGDVWLAGQKSGRRAFLVDPKGGDPDEWPEDLRVRQFPRVD